MKKLFIVFCLIFSISISKAGLVVTNLTGYTIDFTVFCHDNINTSCDYYQSILYSLSPNVDPRYFFYTSEIDLCCQTGNPGSSQGWDDLKFYVRHAPVLALGSIGICTSSSTTSFQSFPGGGSITANWTGSNGNYWVTFS